jgi:hypothetical protein
VSEGRGARLRARLSGRLPWALPALAIAFNLRVLRAEHLAVTNLNDSAMHAQMARFAAARLRDGHLPLSAWYPYLGLGSPHFHHYQSLGHLLTGGAAALLGIGADTAFGWALYLLLALWPLSVYAGARLFGLGRWPAAGAALLAPLLVSTPGYGYEHGSYVWQGYGMWTQLWGMWLLPVAWALTYRAVSRGRNYAWAAAALALTIALHFLTGYQALVAVAVWVPLRPRQAGRRLVRALAVWVGGGLAAAWVVVPLLRDSAWANQSAYFRHTYFNDSWGARKILGWLVRGDLYDADRLPVVTALVAVGLVVSITRWRRDELSRALVAIWVVALALFFGRPTWGGALKVLPGSDDLLFHRFVMGVHLSGLLLAGVGGEWLARAVLRQAARLRLPARASFAAPVAVAALALLVLAPALRNVADYDARGRSGIELQRLAESGDGANLRALIDFAVRRGGGRVYAGSRGNWGTGYRVGSVPVFTELAARDADAVGFTFRTAGLSTDVEVLFDETKPEQYRLFAIRYLLLPADREPPVPATLLASLGRHRLYEVTGSGGYLQVADTMTILGTDRASLAATMQPFLASGLVRAGIFPTVGFGGRAAEPPTQVVQPDGPAGHVEQEVDLGADGRYVGRVTATRPAVVVLKASYDPRWRARVDGRSVPPFMVAPSFVAVAVPAGTHAVELTYGGFGGYGGYPALFAVGLLALLALAYATRMASGPLARERDPGSDAFADPGGDDVAPPVARPEPEQRGHEPAEVGAAAVDEGAEGNVHLDRGPGGARDAGPVLDLPPGGGDVPFGDGLELRPEALEVAAAGHGEGAGVDPVPDEGARDVPGLPGGGEAEPEVPVGGVPEVLAQPAEAEGGGAGEDDGGHGEEVLHEQPAEDLAARDRPGADGDAEGVARPPLLVDEPAPVHDEGRLGPERLADRGEPPR